MRERIITKDMIESFIRYLKSEEKSKNTIEKYERDVTAFYVYIDGAYVNKESVIAYKNKLICEEYSPRSINSMLSSINSFLCFVGWEDCKVKAIRIQHQMYCAEDKELTKSEYTKLVRTAQKLNNIRLYLILQTICATGIRVSELQYITVEAVKNGRAIVSLKGKIRQIFIVRELQKKLMKYICKNHIKSGPVFITCKSKPISRITVWREMKRLCEYAGVNSQKVFPHNLRHLFARIFYKMENDIAKLADILGHSSINTTRIYIISSGNEHRRYMENMKLII